MREIGREGEEREREAQRWRGERKGEREGDSDRIGGHKERVMGVEIEGGGREKER